MRIAVEAVMVATMLLGLLGFLYQRIKLKMGIGVRSIQFLSILFIVPAVVVLAFEQILEPDVVAALFGAIIGYLLAGFGQERSLKNSKG